MLNNAIIGYNGFVGSNLNKTIKAKFLFNSKNIKDIKNKSFNKLFICAPHAQKWLANKNPKMDNSQVNKLIHNLKNISAKKVIYISTVDVFENLINKNEKSKINKKKHHTYGKNRLKIEKFIKKKFIDYHIIRLPALFGKGLKKNILFDLINNNNLHNIKILSKYQWFSINDLNKCIKLVIKNKIACINLVSEPIHTFELISKFFPDKLIKCNSSDIGFKYNLNTIYSKKFKNKDGYIYNKNQKIKKIKRFLKK